MKDIEEEFNGMDMTLVIALATQLSEQGSTIFMHNELYYHVYESEQADYGYDIYSGMDEYDSMDGGVFNSVCPINAITTLL